MNTELQRLIAEAAVLAGGPWLHSRRVFGAHGSMKYFIQYRGACGNEALWWRPNGAGYTTNIDDAGQYDEERALAQERVRDMDKAWPVDQVLAIAHRSVNVNRLLELSNPPQKDGS